MVINKPSLPNIVYNADVHPKKLKNLLTKHSLREACPLLGMSFEQLEMWELAFPEITGIIRKHRIHKSREKYKIKYRNLLKEEFAAGGNVRTFAERYDIPFPRVLSWLHDYEEFSAAHQEAIERNIEVIGQSFLDHMREGLSADTFPSSIGEKKETVKEWAQKYQSFADVADMGRDMMIERLEKDGMDLNKVSSSSWIFTMKNKAGWKGDETPANLPRNVVIMLPEKKRQIDKGSVIEIREAEEAPLDMNALGEG